MIFDRFCGIAERHLPSQVSSALLQAALFEFPGRAHEVFQKERPTLAKLGGPEFADLFFLPFPVTVMEDTASAVMLIDVEKEQRGMNTLRGWVECLPMDLSRLPEFATVQHPNGTTPAPKQVPKLTDRFSDCFTITCGTIKLHPDENSNGFDVEGNVMWCVLASKNRVLQRITAKNPPPEWEVLTQSSLRNVACAMEEVLFFNRPDRFIVERRNVGARPPHRDGNGNVKKIPRSDSRPRYILLTPEEIRETLRTEGDVVTHAVGAHARRRHYRTLRDERFTNKQGEVVVVKACWVGPDEGTVGSRHYRVLLDR